jgi:hypothetical protein
MRQMKRLLVLLAIAALAIPTAASAKGPAGAVIEGPGIDGRLQVPGAGEYRGTPLGDLTHYAGFFPAVFGGDPQVSTSKERPKGDLGPRYTVTYSLPTGDETVAIRQDMYPYANPPVTYTEPGQRVYDGRVTTGGWYTKGIPALRVRLIEARLLPATPPSLPAADDDALVSADTALAVIAAMALLLLATAVVGRRRPTDGFSTRAIERN